MYFILFISALCILLRRLTYPNRLGDICHLFGRSKTQLSFIINYMFNFIEVKFGHLMETLDLFWLSPTHLEQFAESICRKGSPLDNCVGFIDGKKNYCNKICIIKYK